MLLSLLHFAGGRVIAQANFQRLQEAFPIFNARRQSFGWLEHAVAWDRPSRALSRSLQVSAGSPPETAGA